MTVWWVLKYQHVWGICFWHALLTTFLLPLTAQILVLFWCGMIGTNLPSWEWSNTDYNYKSSLIFGQKSSHDGKCTRYAFLFLYFDMLVDMLRGFGAKCYCRALVGHFLFFSLMPIFLVHWRDKISVAGYQACLIFKGTQETSFLYLFSSQNGDRLRKRSNHCNANLLGISTVLSCQNNFPHFCFLSTFYFFSD